MNFKPVATEKAVRLIELNNTMTFNVDMNATKTEIKKEAEEIFNVKIESVKTLLNGTKKVAYIKLKKEFPAIDLATKLGLI